MGHVIEIQHWRRAFAATTHRRLSSALPSVGCDTSVAQLPRSGQGHGGAFYSERAQLACASLSVCSTERASRVLWNISGWASPLPSVLASDSNLVVVGAGAVETDRKERREGELTAHGACSRPTVARRALISLCSVVSHDPHCYSK